MRSFFLTPPITLDRLHGFPWPAALVLLTCAGCTVGGWKLLHRLNEYYSVQSLNNWEEDDSWDWEKEVVVVTGGSNGIGLEMVRRLVQRGIKVAIWDLMPPPADVLKFPCAHFYTVDVTNEEMIVSSAKQLRTDLGDPTVLINNAGVARAQNILEESLRNRKLQFDINVLAQMRLVQEFLPSMIARNHGHIVTMASASSFITTAKIVTYASTKAAVMAFHEGVGQELRIRYHARRVRTSIVYPHFVRTAMVGNVDELKNFPEMLLTPEYVADEVVAQVLSGKAGRLILPPANAFLSRLRALPPWYMYRIHSMDADVYKNRASDP